MDKNVHDSIHALAEENGLDPIELEKLFAAEPIPGELMAAMEAALGDVGMFAAALDKLNDKE